MKNDDMFEYGENDIFSSSSSTSNNMEDIISDSQYYTGANHYSKKKRGLGKFFSNIGCWWKSCHKWQKALMISGVSIILVVAIAFSVIRVMFNYNYNAISSKPKDLGFENVIDKKIVNIALFGIDTRTVDSFKGLSDSIMILSINTETKKIKVMSVMRDSLVPITYNGKTTYTKINAAYSKGGPELAIKTLNTIFKLDISEYATVNFFGMADIIEAVGGIEATLTQNELDVSGYENGVLMHWGLNGLIDDQCSHLGINPSSLHIKKAGTYHLNGIQAVAYARIRHAANFEGTNDDYGRTDRQRYVMEQLFNKATKLSKSEYIKLAKALIPCSQTSLSYTEIMGLAVNVLLHSPTFEQTRVPLRDYQMNNSHYVYYDLNYTSKLLHAFIYEDIKPEDYIATNGVEKNDWYANRGGTTTTKKPSSTTSSNNSKVTSSSSSDNTSKDVSTKPKDDEVSSVVSDISSNESTVTSSEPSSSSSSTDSSTTSSEGTSTSGDGTEE